MQIFSFFTVSKFSFWFQIPFFQFISYIQSVVSGQVFSVSEFWPWFCVMGMVWYIQYMVYIWYIYISECNTNKSHNHQNRPLMLSRHHLVLVMEKKRSLTNMFRLVSKDKVLHKIKADFKRTLYFLQFYFSWHPKNSYSVAISSMPTQVDLYSSVWHSARVGQYSIQDPSPITYWYLRRALFM